MSLRARIVLGYALLLVSSFSLVIYLILKDVRPRYLEALEESTVDTAELLAAVVAQELAEGKIQTRHLDQAMTAIAQRSLAAKIYGMEKSAVNLSVYITDKSGQLIYDSTGKAALGSDFSKWNDVLLTLKGKYGARSTRTIPDDPTTSTIFVGAPIRLDGEIVGVVSVGKSKNSVSFFIEIAKRKFQLVLALIGVSAIGLGVVLSSWITRPIRLLTEYVESMKRGEAKRLPELGSSEIGSLGRALEETRAKLEGKNYIEDYVRTLTHEMKSPLTAIRGASEILREEMKGATSDKFLSNIDTEAARLQNLVERMLELSRLENVKTVARESVPLGPLIHELKASLATALDARRLRLEILIPAELKVQGDAFLIRQAISNLLLNAIDFSPESGRIQVEAMDRAGKIVISVRDQGSGIPEFALERVFEKFFSLERPGTGRKSTGLGLPFVREVAALHGGDVKLLNTAPGLSVELVLRGS